MTQPTDSGLRPCPFCKSDALRLEQTSPLHFSVNCNSCGSQIHRITEAEAISAWNTRPSAPDDEAVKALTEVRPKRVGGKHDHECCDGCDASMKAVIKAKEGRRLEALRRSGKL